MLSLRGSGLVHMLAGLMSSVGARAQGTVDAPPIKPKRRQQSLFESISRNEHRRMSAYRPRNEYERTHGFSGAKLLRRVKAGTVGRAALK